MSETKLCTDFKQGCFFSLKSRGNERLFPDAGISITRNGLFIQKLLSRNSVAEQDIFIRTTLPEPKNENKEWNISMSLILSLQTRK